MSASPARMVSHRARTDSDGYLSRDKVVEASVRQNDIVGYCRILCYTWCYVENDKVFVG